MSAINFTSRHRNTLKFGDVEARYSANYSRILRYTLDIWQTELELHKQVSAPELYLLEIKVAELVARWDRMVDEARRKSRLAASKESCDAMSIEASAKLDGLHRILAKTLSINDRVEWDRLKSDATYIEAQTFTKQKPIAPTLKLPSYIGPQISFWDVIFGRKALKLLKAKQEHEERVSQAEANHRGIVAAVDEEIRAWAGERAAFVEQSARRRREFEAEQARANAEIDKLAEAVADGDPKAVLEHASLVLDTSDYDALFEKSYELDYQPAPAKTLMLEYELPSPEIMPVIKSVKFIASTGEVKETRISEKEEKANYDSVCYQICLRTLHEMFEADEHDNIAAVLFNGYSTSIDRATGQEKRACIMSVLVTKADFLRIELSRIDPKACFKSLKGVSASSLAALAPIAPVMEMNKQDSRFIDARTVVDNLDGATNLAALDWADFEHLVRELFEKEFASRGGEVKITQSSSDGGVDAVAFDPDPITGGKIVIQAKRYTRTVGVSAVRDLYGTLQHEGASRGILITTADYGPDAHSFANGKPISLFTGAHLLHLLEKHGYKAKIDIQEARKLMREDLH